MNLDYMRGEMLFYVAVNVALLLVTLGVLFMLRRVVLRRMVDAPVTVSRPFARKMIDGVWLGVVALGLAVLPAWIGQGFAAGPGWTAFRYGSQLEPGAGWLVWGFYGVQSLAEELLFRVVGMGLLAILLFWLAGFLFAPAQPQARRRFTGWLWLGSGLAANVITAISFGWVHAGNMNATPLALMNIALAGMVLGQLFWQQGSPLGAWMLHWVWNAGLTSLGLPVSGYAVVPPLLGAGFVGARAGILTGGTFGPEGSLVCSFTLALVWAWLLWQGIAALREREEAVMSPNDGISN